MENLNQILQLPEKCLVNKKITKAFFKRNFDLTLTERKLIESSNIINQIDWVASVKPQNSNIPPFVDQLSTYEEIQVITVKIGEEEFDKVYVGVIEFIQKQIPYHILLAVYSQSKSVWNTTAKKINLKDSTKRTIERPLTTEIIQADHLNKQQRAFYQQCSFENTDKHDLSTFYHSFESNITSLQASAITGEFKTRAIERAITDVPMLEEIKRLENEILNLQIQAKKETQLNAQVQLNSEVQNRRNKIAILKENLK
jgi:hypothetical protein